MRRSARQNAAAVTLAEWCRDNWVSMLLFTVALGLVYYDIVRQMVRVWSINDDYSHGFLVPLVSAYFLWSSRESLLKTEVRPADFGLLVFLVGVVQLVLASLSSEYFNSRASLVVVMAGAVIYAVGWKPFKSLRLPLFYLLLMIPVPAIIYDTLTLPLKMLVAKISVKGLVAFGYSVVREGNIIMLPNITLEVADACSGLRSLMSLLALSIAFAFLTQKRAWKRWLLIVSAFPIAIFTNILRVFCTGMLAKHYGHAAAEGFFHEFAGMMVFAVAMVLMMLLGAILRIGADKHES